MILKERIAIVTGASRGIGKAIAIEFAKEGASVVIAARSEQSKGVNLPGSIYETLIEIERLGGRGLAVRCDVTNEESVNSMVQNALAVFGRVDILVNNAGVALPLPIIETSLNRWELILKVNLTGAFLCTKAILPGMIDRRTGSIINISSLAANERDGGTVATGVAYGVAKAGIERFTWGLAAEVGKYNIAVNCMKPQGIVDTEGMRFWVPKEDREGWVSAEKMVKCAVFLASQNAKAVTGVVATDGEFCAWHGL